jgi:hypothetical protein
MPRVLKQPVSGAGKTPPYSLTSHTLTPPLFWLLTATPIADLLMS